MKKTLIFAALFISIVSTSSAKNLQTLKMSILSSLAHGLIAKKSVTVYLADNTFLKKGLISKDKGVKFTNNCDSAQLVVAGSLKNLSKKCLKKPIFATNYTLYKSSHVIGVLFWQKGRPVLILKKNALEKKHLKVKSYLEKYIQ